MMHRWLYPHFIRNYLHYIFDRDVEKAIGFKFMYVQANKTILKELKRHNLKAILLVRNNYLKIYLSEILAKKTTVWHRFETDKKAYHLEPVSLDLTATIKRLREIEKIFQELDAISTGFDTLKISYEDLCSGDFENCIKRILDHIGVDAAIPLKTKMRKVNPNSVREMVANYEELVEALSGTPYARFLSP